MYSATHTLGITVRLLVLGWNGAIGQDPYKADRGRYYHGKHALQESEGAMLCMLTSRIRMVLPSCLTNLLDMQV